jgi:hypothetical protein
MIASLTPSSSGHRNPKPANVPCQFERTDLGEYHAWWEADGGFTYTRGAMTEVSTDYSINGSVWHASLGAVQGPYALPSNNPEVFYNY